MQTPRPAPRLARGPQQFTQGNLPPIQSPMMLPPQQPMQQAADEPFQDLAMEIYARLAVDHISKNQTPNAQTLQDLAKSAQAAALAYFEVVMK